MKAGLAVLRFRVQGRFSLEGKETSSLPGGPIYNYEEKSGEGREGMGVAWERASPW
jgi:hypothetical protein